MKVFEGKLADSEYQFICGWQGTRTGFKHTCDIAHKGNNAFLSTKINYINRTWERYDYESVLDKATDLLVDAGKITKEEKTELLEQFRKQG